MKLQLGIGPWPVAYYSCSAPPQTLAFFLEHTNPAMLSALVILTVVTMHSGD